MTKEDLLYNDPNSNDYVYKLLLRELKDLDSSLTKFLVRDFYEKEKTSNDDVMCSIKVINDITNYILEKRKGIEGADYRNYFEGQTEGYINHSNMIHKAWCKMLAIKEHLTNKLDSEKFSLEFNKGFSFEFVGSSNYCSIHISYIEETERCRNYIHIISITTTNGENFSIYKSEEYYKLANLDLENYRKNIDRCISCDSWRLVVGNVIKLANVLEKEEE